MADETVRTGLPDAARSGSRAGFPVVRLRVEGEGLGFVGEIRVDPDELLTGPEVARLLEISPAAWRMLVMRGAAPVADDPGGDGPVNQRRPRWRLESVRDFKQSRPGKGWRRGVSG